MSEAKARVPNRLIKEKSPYLLQHAHNPVEWYPWGEEALRRAKNDNKPIFLSIGYSTCHWCHQMAHESYESEKVAAILNKNFIPVKVDREERPEVDEFYMKAVQALTGRGGWPLNVFLTPDLRPFYGGTYFPPEPRYGLPSFTQLLEFVARLWKEKRDDIQVNASRVIEALKESYAKAGKGELSSGILDAAYASVVSAFDSEYGGFGGAPKFPLPTSLNFLMRYYLWSKKELALRSVVKTLESMAAGGIHDHLGGGFHRYSTDRVWLVPHFEKMLYDNTLIARAYLEGFQLTADPRFADVARGIFDWLLTEMADRGGGFYSAQDADTPEGEGVYYTWTVEEVDSVLGERKGETFRQCFGVTRNGNFEKKRSILHLPTSLESAARRLGIPEAELERSLAESKKKLYEERLKRARPETDDKILTSWNGLAISALSYGCQVLGEERYLKAAERCASFIVGTMHRGERLLRRYRDGESAIDGTLEDYSFLTQGLLDLYETDFEAGWLKTAVQLNGEMTKLFRDEERGGFFMQQKRDELPAEIKEGYDGPTPSGNSVAALNLLRIGEFTGRDELRKEAERTLRIFQDDLEGEPSSHTYMLVALDFLLGSPREIVVAEGGRERAHSMVREIHGRLIPNKVLMVLSNDGGELESVSPLAEGKKALRGNTTAYICQNYTCKKPITDLEELKSALSF
ncbi:MAG TPA: thioredoxin domain-containing protein [Nitrososphaerales archaeon]|nr:thioredoxin domain-containing protein [Nitrososphaerales archaeon]